MLKILFIYPNIVESPKDISTGLGILASIAKFKAHKTALIDTTFGLTDKEIISKSKSFSPDLIVLTTATNDFPYSTKICSMLKKIMPQIPIIAGGFHPTIAPEEVISKNCFDMICIGEGEEAFSELIDSLEANKPYIKIKNLWVKDNKGKIHKNPIRKLVENLDSFPFPNRELFNYEKYLSWNRGTFSLISTRGCPFKCTYCINHFLQKTYSGKGKYLRFRSVDNLIEEIKQATGVYGDKIKSIEFYDDTFTLDKERVIEFAKKYPKEIGLPFNLNVRVNAVTHEIFSLLKKAGCIRVSIGVEAGDDFILNKILKRNMSDKKIIETFKAAKSVGLKTYAFNMIGIPYETKKSIKKTINLNRKCKPDYVGVSIFNVFKGTEIYDLVEEKGWLKKDKFSKSYFRDSNVNHPSFTSSQLRKIRNSFGFKVYISYKPTRAIIDLFDKKLSDLPFYLYLRSNLISKLKILKLLEKLK